MNTEVKDLTIELLQDMGEVDFLMNTRRLSGPAYCWLLEGKPVAAMGLGLICYAEYFAWAVIHEDVRRSKLLMRRLCREIKRRYPVVRDSIHAEYISAETSADPMYCKWLERLLGLSRLPIVRYGWSRS